MISFAFVAGTAHAAKELEEKALGASMREYFARTFDAEVVRVTARRTSITIKYSSDEPLTLVEVRPWQHVQRLTSADDIEWSKPARAGTRTISVPRLAKAGGFPYDRIHSRWCLVKTQGEEVELRSHAACCDDGSKIAVKSIPIPKPRTKKGLQINWRPSAMHMLDELGIKHAAVNVQLTGLLNIPKRAPSIEHTYLGRKFRINKRAVDNLSRVLAYAAKRGYLMGAIILVSGRAPAHLKEAMLHPDYVSKGTYSMANVATPEGVFHYAMILDFLASYFSSKEHGYIHYWIVHNEVDAAWVWTNCGKRGADTMMDLYVKSMRIVHMTARKYNPKAKTLISLTHFWNAKNKHGPAETMYAPRRLIDIMADHSRVEGDFDWALAYHAYPRDLRNPRTWEDRVEWRFDTDIISYRNLEVLVAYMKQDRYLHDSKMRKIFLTEQGLSNPKDTKEDLRVQAAAVAYAMKKVNGLEGIEAHILHRWVDHAREGGLNLGLVKKKPGTVNTEGEKKPSFDVYAAIGTPREEEACRFALEIIGIKSWDEIFFRGKIE